MKIARRASSWFLPGYDRPSDFCGAYPAYPSNEPMTDTDPIDLSMSRFATAASSDFAISALGPDGPVGAEVILRLQSLTGVAATRDYEQYAMLFTGPVQPLLPQGTYLFTHTTLGRLPLFLVPVGHNAAGAQYEVCISRKLN